MNNERPNPEKGRRVIPQLSKLIAGQSPKPQEKTIDLTTAPVSDASAPIGPSTEQLVKLPVSQIEPDPNQPRKVFEDQEMSELINNIRENGVFEPIRVLPRNDQGRYRIVFGERRWRAAKACGQALIPAIIHPMADEEIRIAQYSENRYRADLYAWEEAIQIKTFVDLYGKKGEVARKLGVDAGVISRYLKLLDLPEPIRNVRAKDVQAVLLLGELYQKDPKQAQMYILSPEKISRAQLKKALDARGRKALQGRAPSPPSELPKDHPEGLEIQPDAVPMVRVTVDGRVGRIIARRVERQEQIWVLFRDDTSSSLVDCREAVVRVIGSEELPQSSE